MRKKLSFEMSVREEEAAKALYLTTTCNKAAFLEARRRIHSKHSKDDICALRWFNNQLSTQQALPSKDGRTRKNGVRTTKERKIFTAIMNKKLTNINNKQLLNENEIESERESVRIFN